MAFKSRAHMEVSYSRAIGIKNEFLFLVGESITVNDEKLNIKDIVIAPSDQAKQSEFFKTMDILPFITDKCELIITLSNKKFDTHPLYLVLESALQILKIEFEPQVNSL